jgi:hypothetical protein
MPLRTAKLPAHGRRRLIHVALIPVFTAVSRKQGNSVRVLSPPPMECAASGFAEREPPPWASLYEAREWRPSPRSPTPPSAVPRSPFD